MMGDPLSLATGVLSVVGFVLQVASGAMAMVDKTVTVHATQRRAIRNLRRELEKTIKGTTNMQIVLNTMLGNFEDRIVKRMCRTTECAIALQELKRVLEATQEWIEQWIDNEDSAPIVPHNALPSNRRSIKFIQAVFKHNFSPSAISDAIDAVEELQFEVTRHREEAESAFQHLWHLYSVQSFRTIQRHASVESLASVSTRVSVRTLASVSTHVSVRTLASISNRIAECLYAEDDGELMDDSNDPIQWLHEQALRADLRPPPINAHVLPDGEGEDATSEDDSSDASTTDTANVLEENQVSPTLVLVEASGTSISDDASHPPSIDEPASLRVVSLYNEHSVTTPLPPSQALQPRPVLSIPPLSSTSHLDPGVILAILQFVGTAASAVCKAVDKVIKVALKERQALQELCKAVESLKSDTLVYRVLLNATKSDINLEGRSPYVRFIQRQDGKESMESLERALKATRLLLEENPGGNRQEVMINPSGNIKPGRALNSVLNVLKANLRPGHRQALIGDLKDATHEIVVCQQNNERAFKLVWNLYVVAQQWTGRRSSVENVGNIQDRVVQALDSVLHAFHVHPFAVSPEGDSRVNLPTFAILNHNHETATRHEQLARRIGKAWVDDRVQKFDTQVRDIAALQASLFELLWSGTVEQLKRDSAYSSGDPERPEFERAVEELERALREAIVRSKKQGVTIAFCGMVKAGKSLFLNALIGRAILPSDELPSTAWPCRIRHVEGQTVPELQFQAEPFLVALRKLQDHQYGRKMQTYQPRPETEFPALLPDAPSEPLEEEVLLRTIYIQWIDLHADTRDNLLKFETPGFKLPQMATGEWKVKMLLGQLNDIVRLCQRFDLKFDMSEVDWPLLTIEFNSLRGHKLDGIYEFIDLPGIGEGFRDPQFNFESLVRLVAPDSNAIVPIVSFKEIPRSDWKRLPELLANGFDGRANVVVCTHLDQVSQDNMDEQLKTVTKTFWPKGVMHTNRVIPCSSLMGLSARDLLDKSSTTKPPFKTIWDRHYVGYRCAAKILGVGAPESTYCQFSPKKWQNQLQVELHYSGLSEAIRKLTEVLPHSARINALFREANTIVRLLREMSNVQERKLLEARRTKDDYNSAKRGYDRAREQFQAALDTWNREEHMQIHENRLLLENASSVIWQKAYGLIGQAIERTLQDWRLGNIQSEDRDLGRRPRGASAGEQGGVKVLTVKTVAHAEEFLRLSQRELHSALNTVKLEYVTAIRKLAETAKDKRFKALRDAIKLLDPRFQPRLRDAIVGDLESQSIDIRHVAFQQIRNVIKTTATRHTAQTAFRAIEEKLARRWIGPGSPITSDGEFGSGQGDDAEAAIQRSIDDLGFMLRAPITMLATVPFAFGLPIWPWKVHSRAYHLEMDIIHDRYRDEIVDPWIRSLKEEGEKSLIGTLRFSSKVAKDLVTSALEREDNRYKRELEGKNKLVDQDTVKHLIASYGNLVAAEEALRELFARVEGLQERSGQ